MTGDEELGCAALLAGLPGMGPARLRAIVHRWGPVEGWARATSGRADRLAPVLEPPEGPAAAIEGWPVAHDPRPVVQAWAAAGLGADPQATLAAHHAAGVLVLLEGDERFPHALRADLAPPAVLFAQGSLEHLEHPRAAIVGTRRCTGVGAGMARELGRELALNGVMVVSGLALGIDGAAHRGVLDGLGRAPDAAAGPVAVVGSGLDVVYPSRHRDLWAAVRDHGLLLSEAPLGTRPAPWRFPARNRLIAALADVVVVVESHITGGSLLTVGEAERRDVPVLAVPGSVRSPAAAGTNHLLADGCHPVRDVTDVLVALGLTPAARRRVSEHRPTPSANGTTVLEAFDWEPATLEHLAARTHLPLGELVLAVEALLADGWVRLEGGWYERVAAA